MIAPSALIFGSAAQATGRPLSWQFEVDLKRWAAGEWKRTSLCCATSNLGLLSFEILLPLKIGWSFGGAPA